MLKSSPLSRPGATSFPQADRLINRLSQSKQTWLTVSQTDRIACLQACIQGVLQVAHPWVEATCLAKGLAPTSSLAGEEWLVGPVTILSYLRRLMKTLAESPRPQPLQVRSQPAVVRVFPDTLADRLMWLGFTGEVWIEPGKSPTQGRIYQESMDTGKVALVLGAGNVSATGILDALYKLFAANEVVVLKMHPVNDYLGTLLEQAFQPLRQAGWLELVYGGAELGAYLCQHPLIDTVHITGSHRTHDAIVWGDRTAQLDRKATQTPRLTKPITSELGCVTPILVVPGQWSEADIAFQAHHIASMVTNNASFNCVAAKVVVTANGWAQRQAFLDRLHQELAHIPPRQAYYPGALDRYQKFCQHYPVSISETQTEAEKGGVNLSVAPSPMIPWTVIPDVPPLAGEYALTEEAFCGVLAEVSLTATSAADFLVQATEFANETIWGSLSCVVLVDRQTQRRDKKSLETAIAHLRYGAIGINVWTGVMYCLSVFPWGAYPGNRLEDIESGQGFVHNANLFDHPQKSVLRAPFRIFPKPSWFANHRTGTQLGQRLAEYYAAPSWQKFLAIVGAAIRG